MKQTSFADVEFAKTRMTRREKFLGEMDRIVPWARWTALRDRCLIWSGHHRLSRWP
jgi:IS5 family transposase